MHQQRCFTSPEYECYSVLLRQGLSGCGQRRLLALCCQYLVLDWSAELVPCQYSVSRAVKLVEQLHLRAWLHWSRRNCLHSLFCRVVQDSWGQCSV